MSVVAVSLKKKLKHPVRDYLAAVLPGFADLTIQRLPNLTPTVLGAQDSLFFQAEDGIRDLIVTGVQTCALPILTVSRSFSIKALTDTHKLTATTMAIKSAIR